MNKYRLADWSKAPEWAVYHVVDEDGWGSFWGLSFIHNTIDNSWEIHRAKTLHSEKYDLTGIDWKETLESRPVNVIDTSNQ